MKKEQPFETRAHDLTGHASIDFHAKNNFNAVASKLAGYNAARFRAVALRFFVQKGIPAITIYALDTSKQGINGTDLPVKKFKLRLTLSDFMNEIKRMDFTVTDGVYNIKDMKIINK